MHSNSLAMESRYRRAQRFEQARLGDNHIAANTRVIPHWLDDGKCFWYRRESLSPAGCVNAFRFVDAKKATNESAFDHGALATALTLVSGQKVDKRCLPFDSIELRLSRRQVVFSAFGKHWNYNVDSQTCEEISIQPLNWKISPDGNKAVFVHDDNLWFRNLSNGEEKQLTEDGTCHYSYASTPTVLGRQEPITLEALWSFDSKRIFTLVKDTRKVSIGTPLVRHVPPAHIGFRPDIIDPDRRVAFPGDEHVEGYYFLAIDVETGECSEADYKLCPVFYPHYLGFFSGGRGWWSPDNQRAYFIDLERNGLTARLIEFDTHTGSTRILIEEHSETRFNFIPAWHLGVMLKPLPGGRELIWYSERSGWAHLYLYDIETGQLKNPITQGSWVVRNVLHVDTDRRELIIQTAGRVPDRNPYCRDICRVHIDTGELNPLLSTEHEYIVCDPSAEGSTNLQGVSPSGDYIVATRSCVNEIPVSLVLDSIGKVILELEVADVSGLPEGWQWPEPVALKAADGNTDIYGIIFRPSDFSSEKSYPVLDFSPNGDHIPAGSFSNSSTVGSSYLTAAAYAELGFIVVMIRSRGTGAGLRSVRFHADKDAPFLNTSHQDDWVAGIQQLAARYPYMNIDRVGIGGYSSPPAVLAGMFRYSDFYKVGVSCNPFSDSRLHWNLFGQTLDDQHLSLDKIRRLHNLEDDAKQLKGKLMLIHGMLDNCTPVASTLRIVDALQKANKDFDLLLLPNFGHYGGSGSRYMLRRTWDYYVKHLQNIEPPSEFDLPAGLEIDEPNL